MGACRGVAVPLLDLIPEEQAAEAPCQGEREEAWASEAFLQGTNKFTDTIEHGNSLNPQI